jgi:hypothetical protein
LLPTVVTTSGNHGVASTRYCARSTYRQSRSPSGRSQTRRECESASSKTEASPRTCGSPTSCRSLQAARPSCDCSSSAGQAHAHVGRSYAWH